MSKQENELRLLDEYHDEINTLCERLSEADDAQRNKRFNKEIKKKISVLENQVLLYKNEFPADESVKLYESSTYRFKAMSKVFSQSFFRRVSRDTGSAAVAIFSGIQAKFGEFADISEAIRLIDQAINIYDSAVNRYFRAGIYYNNNQKEKAINDLNYIIENFQNDEIYIAARKMKDEIEATKCFIATAAFGSETEKEVSELRWIRDNILRETPAGKRFFEKYWERYYNSTVRSSPA